MCIRDRRKTSTIESKAFAKCKNMSIIMPSGITAISDDAFDGASGITTVSYTHLDVYKRQIL